MAHGDELIQVLARLGLEDARELLAPYATVEIGLVASADGRGAARIGGAPDLPADAVWPSHRWPLAEVAGWPPYAIADVDRARAEGRAHVEGDELVVPLLFLLQVDLGSLEVVDARLPRRGLLAFFASPTTDIEDPLFAKRVAAAVCYFDDSGPRSPRLQPPTVDDPPANPITLVAQHAIRWSIPFEEMPRLEAALGPTRYASLVADARRDVHALLPAPAEECVGPMPPPGEVALLRLHDDPDAGFRVGDASWITFSLAEADLRACRFAGAHASVFIG